jgi:hypothetical protein
MPVAVNEVLDGVDGAAKPVGYLGDKGSLGPKLCGLIDIFLDPGFA